MIFVVRYHGDTIVSAVKYFAPSFETEQKFLVLSAADELKKEMYQQVFSTSNEMRRCIKVFLVAGSCDESRMPSY